MPESHHSVFLQAGCPSCRPTDSIKALKAKILHTKININIMYTQYHQFTKKYIVLQCFIFAYNARKLSSMKDQGHTKHIKAGFRVGVDLDL